MIIQWLRNRRRRKFLTEAFPEQWESILRSIPQFHGLSEVQRQKLRRCVRIFVAEKFWEGCNGQEITDEIKVTIAGQACLLLLGLEIESYDNPKTILVYPDIYVAKATSYHSGGVVSESSDLRLGEAHYRGPVILSWADVRTNKQTPTKRGNTVVHEFAHVLDMQDGLIDGTPSLRNEDHYQTWRMIMSDEYQQLNYAVRRGESTLIDPYGATNEAEFFAVATECFFDLPSALSQRHPRLYGLLRDFYQQDPAAWGVEG